MGNLKPLVFTATVSENSRLDTSTLRSLNISHEHLLSAHSTLITDTQATNKEHITMTHKELPKTQTPQWIMQNQTACEKNYGNKVIRTYGYKGDGIPLSNPVINQSDEEWMESYLKAEKAELELANKSKPFS
jgi:hypothetical protein